ncbi:MAG: hypothetical protein QOD76_218 [Solirubrobacteraceae bacterium]|jgi:low temperature requirement protein LtrA|nr:hypothetical protein [Solirubrobacteraceae bacterium]
MTEERRTSPVELLRDLVFVFALTQVTTLLSHDLSWAGLGRSMLVLFVAGALLGAYALGSGLHAWVLAGVVTGLLVLLCARETMLARRPEPIAGL